MKYLGILGCVLNSKIPSFLPLYLQRLEVPREGRKVGRTKGWKEG